MNDAKVNLVAVVLILFGIFLAYKGYFGKLNSTPNSMQQLDGNPKKGYMIQTCIMYSRGNEAYLNCDSPTKS